MRQISLADMVVVNKVDLAGPEQVERVKIWIDDRISSICIIETNYCDVPYHVLLGVRWFENGRVALDGIGHGYENDLNPTDHGQTFSTWSYETDQPVSLIALRYMVKNTTGLNLSL